MNGTKPQSMAIDGLSSNLALDYVNKYLYYLSLSSHRIYRIDYEIFTAPPQSILWLTKDTVSNFFIGSNKFLPHFNKGVIMTFSWL